ncbi:MAG: ImmA/IrrE family metallo-endopeptidase [Acidiferrobacteraceae bacterium]
MKKSLIENTARELCKRIWQQRAAIWPDKVSPNPRAVLEPELAAQVLGINFQYHEELGRFGDPRGRYEVAGILDRQARKIAISKRFSLEARRFTAAHELGHWLLHPDHIMHRDRPIAGLSNETISREPKEREADYFAACFLMPDKLVTAAFESTFRTKAPFVFDDDSAWWLCPDDPDSLLRADIGSMDRALAFASAESYRGVHLVPLAKQFRVSVTTMAIRLKELELIRE